MLQEIEMDPAIKERVRYWLGANFDEETKKEVRALIEKGPQELIDAFYTTLAFGTGGLRGVMGVGSNRMNKYTIRWATQGLATYLQKQYAPHVQLKVAIGYDSRNNSQMFAREAARVLAGNGIEVFLFPHLCPTPLVSFACRHLQCHAAIMITASHNPPKYNGYKVYWNDGAQVLPPHDRGIIEEVSRLNDPDQVRLAPADDPRIILIGREVEEAYLQAIKSLQLWPDETGGEQLKILYSSLHGTGITIVPGAFRCYGFPNVAFVEEQKEPDGAFPTTPRPNPEEKAALQLGIDKLLKTDCDVFFATDPDADRIGVVVKHQGEAVLLTGNQVACIAAEFVCRARKAAGKMPSNAAFVKTIVTTELFKAIVQSHKASCFDVLTGFKYVAEKIRQWESDGQFCYLFGGEESYGYLLGTKVRDKDAVCSACMLAEIALQAKKHGKTLVDLLNDIYAQHGMYQEGLISLEFPDSKEGKEHMQMLMEKLRTETPASLSNIQVVKVGDLLSQQWRDSVTGVVTPIELPSTEGVILILKDGSKIVIRPSGTEPKMKVYLMVAETEGSNIGAKERAILKIEKFKDAIKTLLS